MARKVGNVEHVEDLGAQPELRPLLNLERPAEMQVKCLEVVVEPVRFGRQVQRRKKRFTKRIQRAGFRLVVLFDKPFQVLAAHSAIEPPYGSSREQVPD